MVTPFGPDGDLDLDAARALARHLVANGSEGLVLAGTTGEEPTVNDVERVQLIEAVVDEVGDRASVIATTGTYDTRHSVHLTREARAAGADALPGRHAVLLEAAGRGHLPPLPRHRRRRRRPADRRLQHPAAGRHQPAARAAAAPRRDRQRDRRQAGDHRHRPGAAHRRRRPRAVRRQRRPAGAVRRDRRRRRHLRRLARGGQRHAGAGRSLRRRRHGSRPGARRRAVAALRRASR